MDSIRTMIINITREPDRTVSRCFHHLATFLDEHERPVIAFVFLRYANGRRLVFVDGKEHQGQPCPDPVATYREVDLSSLADLEPGRYSVDDQGMVSAADFVCGEPVQLKRGYFFDPHPETITIRKHKGHFARLLDDGTWTKDYPVDFRGRWGFPGSSLFGVNDGIHTITGLPFESPRPNDPDEPSLPVRRFRSRGRMLQPEQTPVAEEGVRIDLSPPPDVVATTIIESKGSTPGLVNRAWVGRCEALEKPRPIRPTKWGRRETVLHQPERRRWTPTPHNLQPDLEKPLKVHLGDQVATVDPPPGQPEETRSPALDPPPASIPPAGPPAGLDRVGEIVAAVKESLGHTVGINRPWIGSAVADYLHSCKSRLPTFYGGIFDRLRDEIWAAARDICVASLRPGPDGERAARGILGIGFDLAKRIEENSIPPLKRRELARRLVAEARVATSLSDAK